MISQYVNAAPVAPSSHNTAVPAPLEALIMRMLAKAPDERPEGVVLVADELRRMRGLAARESRTIEDTHRA